MGLITRQVVIMTMMMMVMTTMYLPDTAIVQTT